MSPDEVVNAITAANTISPSGNISLGEEYPMVPMNAVVRNIKDLEGVPIRVGVFPAIYVRDVAEVTDGSDIVTSYALVNGRRTVGISHEKARCTATRVIFELSVRPDQHRTFTRRLEPGRKPAIQDSSR